MGFDHQIVGIEDGKLGPTGELGRSVEATNMGIICAHMEIYCNQK